MIDCRATSTSILSIWNGVDAYLIEADKAYCSTSCPCNADLTKFATGSYTPYTLLWTIDKTANGARNFTYCSDAVKRTAYDAAILVDPSLDVDQTFNAAGFSKAFAWVESNWKCTGWCSKSYTKTIAGVSTTIPFGKYIYSDIDRYII